MATLIVEEMCTNSFKPTHSKPIFLSVLPCLVQHSTFSFNRVFSGSYCLCITALSRIKFHHPFPPFWYMYAPVQPWFESLISNYVAFVWVEVCESTVIHVINRYITYQIHMHGMNIIKKCPHKFTVSLYVPPVFDKRWQHNYDKCCQFIP
jgi:hypothetical protein